MPTKVQFYSEVADYAAVQITSNIQNWSAFLRSSGRHYKYDFADQLLIHAQRPHATACADYDCWDKRLRRYVRRGSTGIALLRRMNNKPILTYVFDISDTGCKENATPVYLWKYSDHYQQVVTERLERFLMFQPTKASRSSLSASRSSLPLPAGTTTSTTSCVPWRTVCWKSWTSKTSVSGSPSLWQSAPHTPC